MDEQHYSASASQAFADHKLGNFAALEIPFEKFKTAYELPIGDKVEKTYNGLSYLSWAYAYRYFFEHFPGLFVDFDRNDSGGVVFKDFNGYILRPYLTDGCKRTPSLVFPIMDRKKNAVKEPPDARQINDNYQRAATKCIATYTGLGLKLFEGEDIPKPEDEEKEASPAKPAGRKATSTSKSQPKKDAASAKSWKDELLKIVTENPLGYSSASTSKLAAKAAYESQGYTQASEIKDGEKFAAVVSAMVVAYMKEEGVVLEKGSEKASLDKLISKAKEGADSAIVAIKELIGEKK